MDTYDCKSAFNKRKANFAAKFVVSLAVCLLLCFQTGVAQIKRIKVKSPDRSTVFDVKVKNGHLNYRMLVDKAVVIDWTVLGLEMGEENQDNRIKVKKIGRQKKLEKIAWVFGERDSIVNNYNEATLFCTGPEIQYNVLARVYNGSVAFRYLLPKGDSSIQKFKKELTAFRFTSEYTIYQYNHESVFTAASIDTFNKSCDFPATLTNGKLYVHIGEACNNQFTKAELKRGGCHTV